LEQTERDKAIRKAIDALPEKQRTAFILSKYDDLTQKEIAAIMQSTEGSVEQLLQRAKSRLQKKLSPIVGKK
jgi:RNA polymerase sigma-70 factor (ECF subfamily)